MELSTDWGERQGFGEASPFDRRGRLVLARWRTSNAVPTATAPTTTANAGLARHRVAAIAPTATASSKTTVTGTRRLTRS
ncbi:MAG TPA: hypothetical protein VJP05_10235 [Acidimicrobiia bacterium]|nr:hypothetical protein [Acidimicrobiia bacterium]